MAQRASELLKFLEIQRNGSTELEALEKLRPKERPLKPGIPKVLINSEASVESIYELLDISKESKDVLWDAEAKAHLLNYDPNIENFVGTVKIPVGIAGPIRINGMHANGDYYVPMATTEAALVASYSRGSRLISEAGGISAIIVGEAVNRAPIFTFDTLAESVEFTNWALKQQEEFKQIAEKTTQHGKLLDIRFVIHGNSVIMSFDYSTGDASGQNMVTIATDAVYQHIVTQCPIKLNSSYLDSNFSADKKATTHSFQTIRGKKVTADVTIPKDLFKIHMGITVEEFVSYSQRVIEGGVLSGVLGVQGHVANALASIFIACGQDVACVAESSVALSSASLTKNGDLYCAISMPVLMLGSVGGGTDLPSQKACLEIMGIPKNGGAAMMAEIIAGVVLAGEISMSSAIAGGYFCKAHDLLARAKRQRLNELS